MMKISLRHPSGLAVEFEGDEKAFDRFAKFLAGDLSGFVHGLEPGKTADLSVLPPAELGDNGAAAKAEEKEEPPPLGDGKVIDAHAVAAHIADIGATSDIDRVTVIAHAALEAGMEGIDYPTIEKLYDDMGLPKPTRFAKAFSNAKTRGLVKSVKHGVWATTVQGENYARYGKKPSRRTKRSGNSGKPALNELEAGDGP
jgi:hypothetical protein